MATMMFVWFLRDHQWWWRRKKSHLLRCSGSRNARNTICMPPLSRQLRLVYGTFYL